MHTVVLAVLNSKTSFSIHPGPMGYLGHPEHIPFTQYTSGCASFLSVQFATSQLSSLARGKHKYVQIIRQYLLNNSLYDTSSALNFNIK